MDRYSRAAQPRVTPKSSRRSRALSSPPHSSSFKPPLGSLDGTSETAVNAALAMIEAAAPKNEVEAALAVQMACTHTAAMAVLARVGGGQGSERRMAAMAFCCREIAQRLHLAGRTAATTAWRWTPIHPHRAPSPSMKADRR